MFKSISHISKNVTYHLTMKRLSFLSPTSLNVTKKLSHSPSHIFTLQGEGYGSSSVSTGTKMLMVVCTNT